MQLFQKIFKKKLLLDYADNSDLKFVFNLYNKNVKENNFFSKKIVNFKDHSKWYKKKIRDKLFFICKYQNKIYKKKIGYIRYDILDKKNISVSIAVIDQYKRFGIGRFMLTKTLKLKKLSQNNIIASIKNNNFSSKKFFLSLKFKLIKNNKYILKK